MPAKVGYKPVLTRHFKNDSQVNSDRVPEDVSFRTALIRCTNWTMTGRCAISSLKSAENRIAGELAVLSGFLGMTDLLLKYCPHYCRNCGIRLDMDILGWELDAGGPQEVSSLGKFIFQNTRVSAQRKPRTSGSQTAKGGVMSSFGCYSRQRTMKEAESS